MACHSVRNPRTKQTATTFYENSPDFCPAITDEANGHESGEIFNPSPPAEKAACVKKGRKPKAEEDITLANLKLYMNVVPLESAAKMFGVGRTTFRTRIRKLGIEQWPYKRSTVRHPVQVFQKACVEKGRKRKAEEDITLANLEPYKNVLPLESAAKMFGVCETTFEARIRKLGIDPWPYKRSTEHNPVREVIDALFMDDHEMNYQDKQKLDEKIQEFKDLIR